MKITRSLRHKLSTFLLSLQIAFSLFAPLFVLVPTASAQAATNIDFHYSPSDSKISLENFSGAYSLYYLVDGKIFNDRGQAEAGLELSLQAQSAADEIFFQPARLVLKTEQGSFFLAGEELEETSDSDLELSQTERDFLFNDWQVDSEARLASTNDNVELGVTYSFPLNETVKVKFTKLPEEASPLTIQELELSNELQSSLGSVSQFAYDITTEMNDGDFEFELELPVLEKTEASEIEVKYAETVEELSVNAQKVTEEISLDGDKVKVAELDHMTVFVVVSPNPVNVDCSGAGVGIVGTDSCYNSIQSAINAAGDGDTINVKNGTYVLPSTLNINKELTIIGEDQFNTIIDSTGVGSGYGVYISADNVTLKNFTINPNGATGGGYTIHVSKTPNLVSNLNLENISIDGSYRSAFDIHGTTGGLLKNITAKNSSHGNGLSLTGSDNIVVEGFTSAGNAWGGIALYNSKYTSPNRATHDITLKGNTFSIGEDIEIYEENEFGLSITGIDAQGYDFKITNDKYRGAGSENFVHYKKTLANAGSSAIALQSTPPVIPNTDSVIKQISTGDFYVVDGMKIQQALDEAASGDIIRVMTGTYVEGPQLIIDKNLSIIGEDKSLVTIKPSANTSASGNARGWFLVNSDIFFTLENITLDGTGYDIYQGIRALGPVDIKNNIIKNIAYPTYNGMGIAIMTILPSNVLDNTFENIGRLGVIVFGAGNNVLFKGNTYFGKGDGDWLDYGIEIGGGGGARIEDNTISNCTGIASSDGSTSAAVLATDLYGPGTSASLVNNQIHDNSYGVSVGYGSGSDATLITQFNGNVFTNNDYDLENNTANQVDARGNTWSVSDQTDLDQVEAKINQDCSNSPFVHGVCDANDDSSYSSVRYAEIATPSNLGWNVSSETSNPGETPVKIACGGYTNDNTPSHVWGSVAGVNIKYQRQAKTPAAYWWTDSTGYTSTNTPFVWFGNASNGIEGLWSSRVRSYVDTNGNNIPDAGEESSAWSNECDITYDKTAPTQPIITAPANNLQTNVNAITVLWTGGDDQGPVQSGIKGYVLRYEFTPLNGGSVVNWSSGLKPGNPQSHSGTYGHGQGTYKIYVKTIDQAGNESLESAPLTVTYDATAPSAPTGIRILDHAGVNLACSGFTNNRNITIDWDDSSDSDFYRFLLDLKDKDAHKSLTISEYDATIRDLDGDYKYKIRTVDQAGNIGEASEWCGVTLDRVAPLVAISSPTATFINGTVEVRGSVTDANPHHYWLVIQNSSGAKVAGPGVVNETVSFNNRWFFDWDTNGVADGDYTIKLEARDAADNKDSGSVEWRKITVDNGAPESVITTPNGVLLSSTANQASVLSNSWDGSIAGTASDAISGVKKVWISIQRSSDAQFWNGAAWVTGTEETVRVEAIGTNSWTYSGLTNLTGDTYIITSHAEDLVGNVENTYQLTVILDKTIPEVNLSTYLSTPDGENAWFLTRPTVTLTANDNLDPEHGIVKIEYQWNSQTGSWTEYQNPFQIPAEGAYVLYYRAHDKAGNISDVGIKNLAWDQTNPSGELNVDASPERSAGPDIDVSWDDVTDNVDVDYYRILFDNLDGDDDFSETVASSVNEFTSDRVQQAGTWRITVTAYDRAGNSISDSDEIIIDQTAPAAPVLNLEDSRFGEVDLAWDSVAEAERYIVYYGLVSGEYLYAASVGKVTEFTVEGLTAGNYHFVVRAVDAADNQSANSNEVSIADLAGAAGTGIAEGFADAGEVQGVSDEATEAEQAQMAEEIGSVKGSNIACTPLKKGFFWLLLALEMIILLLLAKFSQKSWLKIASFFVLPAILSFAFIRMNLAACYQHDLLSWLATRYYLPAYLTAIVAKLVEIFFIIED